MESVTSKKSFRLGGIGLGFVGLYLLLVWRYPLGSSLDDPRASWASLVAPTWLNLALHLAIYFGLTLLYILALRLLAAPKTENGVPAGQLRRQVLLIFATWLACSGILMVVAPAGESHDIFDYLFRGRMMVEYHANPLVDVPDAYGLVPPFTRYLAWRKNVDTYGPVWEGTSAAVSVSVRQMTHWLGWWVEQSSQCPQSPESCRLLMAYISGYRLLAIALTGFSGWLIFMMVSRRHPTTAPQALAAWLWSPLTLMTTAVGAHNDAVMIVLLVAGWWLLQRQRPFWALLALILAAHVKLTVLIWLPACVLWIVWRWGWLRAIKTGLASVVSGLALSWLLYAPFGGWQTLPRMLKERSEFVANSFARVLQYLLNHSWNWSVENAHHFTVGLSNWGFIAGALLISLWLFKFRPIRWHSPEISPPESDQSLWRALSMISVLYLLVGSFWFQHWYVLWIIAPAALRPNSRLTRSVLPWLAFGALAFNVAMSFLSVMVLNPGPSIVNYGVPVAIIWAPAVLAAIIVGLNHRKTRKFETAMVANLDV